MSLVTDLIGGFSGIELIWSALAIIGALVSGENAWEALHDLRALKDISNGRRIIARGAVRRESIRTGVYAMYLLIGILAGLRNAVPEAVLSPVAFILVITSLALTLNSVLDRRDRRRIMQSGKP